MKILLFGRSGQVGHQLQRSLWPLGDIIALDKDSSNYCGDFENLGDIRQTIKDIMPDVIVNAAAYTAVDQAESEPDLALAINGIAPAVLAEEAKNNGALLIHYSTDYVFDGSGNSPWGEADNAAPLNVYGHTKLKGDQAIIASGCRNLILRTGWIYDARGNNFANTILRLAKVEDEVAVVDDQIGAPTSAGLLANATAHAVLVAQEQKNINGVFHVAASGEVSRHGYASFVINFARNAGIKLRTGNIMPIVSENISTPAKRPLNSRLNTDKFRNTFNLNLPAWRNDLSRMLSKLLDTTET